MTLAEDAIRLAPELSAAVNEGEELRRLPDTTWKQLLECGFLRGLQPRRWGGGEVTLVEFFDGLIALAKSNTSAAWVAGVIGVHPWQLALFPEEAQEEMWGEDPATMHSSSYAPTGKAEKVAGGYRISGRWSFSSGCDHCRAVNLGAVAGLRDMGGIEIPDFRSFVLFRNDYRIVDNWHTTGMRGTGSKDIVVDDAFVSEYRTQSHLDYAFNRPLPGQEKNDGILYRCPWSAVFNLALVGAVVGTAEAFIDAWIGEARNRGIAFSGPAADDLLFQQRVAEALWELDAAKALIRHDAGMMWEIAAADEHLEAPERARVRWNMDHSVERLGETVAALMRAASGRSIFIDHPLRRLFADMQGMLGHAFLMGDPVARAVGAFALGSSKPPPVM